MASLEIITTPLYAGTDWEIREALSEYPATSNDAKYILKKGTASPIEITPTKDGDTFIFAQTLAETTSLTAGVYNVQLIVYPLGGSVPTKIFATTKEIKVLLSANSGDARTFAERMLDAIQAVAEDRASREQSEMSLPGGVSVQYLTPEEIIKWESHYQNKVNAERRKLAGKSNFKHHQMRMA